MPLCNRVTPWGAIVSHPARYNPATAVFGNRGVLHDDQRQIVRPHASRLWLSCKLSVNRTRKTQRDDNRAFNGRKRVLMTPRRYTELFFLDEPTAMAAGHRPCACCRRQDYQRFLIAWSEAHPRREPWTAAAVDAVLHSERLAPNGSKARHAARLVELPDGVQARIRGTYRRGRSVSLSLSLSLSLGLSSTSALARAVTKALYYTGELGRRRSGLGATGRVAPLGRCAPRVVAPRLRSAADRRQRDGVLCRGAHAR